MVALYTSVMDIAPEERRGEAVSLVTLASYLGLTFGPVAADLIRGSDRYPLVWLVTAALALTATALVATLHETRPETEEPSARSWLPPRGALRPGLLVLLGLLGFGGFVAFGAIYARDLGIERPGLLFALFGGVISLVRFFGRRLPDALGAIRTLELSFVCLAAGPRADRRLADDDWTASSGTVVFAVGQAMTYPSAVLLAVQSTSAAERSAVVGSVGAAVDVALGVGALTLGAVAKFWGYGGAFLVASAVALSGLAALWPMRSASENPRPRKRLRDRRSTRTRRRDDAAARLPRRRHARRPADRPVDSAAAAGDAGRDGRPPRAARRPTSRRTSTRSCARLDEDVLPFMSKGDHPGFFAYVPFAGTWPGALGDLIASATNVYAGSWMESAGPSQLELEVVGWFKDWVGYPAEAAGILVSGGSAANLTALACARESLVGPMSDDLVVYVSDQAHFSVARSARNLGFRQSQVRVIPSDDRSADPRRPARVGDGSGPPQPAVARSSCPRTAARRTAARSTRWPSSPTCVASATSGSTSTRPTAASQSSPSAARAQLAGIERADSITLDPHKWLYQPYECGCLLVRDGRPAPARVPDHARTTCAKPPRSTARSTSPTSASS